jgi:hypothetical protein
MSLQYLNQIETDGLSRLIKVGVAFVLVGSHALLHYASAKLPSGEWRTIGDLDLFIECSSANLGKLMVALSGDGWACSREDVMETLRRGESVNLQPYRIQFLPVLSGVEWGNVFRTSGRVYSAAGSVPVISRDLLIENKRAAGRPKDIEDLRLLGVDPEQHAA